MVRISIPIRRRAPPRIQRDIPILPVLSFTTPTRVGPKNPPRLPAELMSAIPPAAAVPLKKVVESAQKGPIADFNPTRAIISAIIARYGFCRHALKPNPIAAAKAANATYFHTFKRFIG
jgi:hypothetical protein